jgi:NAD(P) transhydrogenase
VRDSRGVRYDYDLLVIGAGPAGQKAAIQTAKLGRRAAVVERAQVGGVCVMTGTIPSKTLRETVLYLTGLNQRAVYGPSYRVKDVITVEDLRVRAEHVISRECEIIRDQLARNHVAVIGGRARFIDPHTVAVTEGGAAERRVSAAFVVVATGTRPARPPSVAFDERTVLDSDSLLRLDRIPRSLIVVGAGVIGMEYASTFATLGSHVTVVDRRPRLLGFCDEEIVEALQYHLRDLGVLFRLRETVAGVDVHEQGAVVSLESGKRLVAEAVLYSAGRRGATDDLDLANAGVATDKDGLIEVGPNYRTAVEHIYAVGDVIGFPSLAATAMEQGRIATLDAFGQEHRSMRHLLPIGIYTIPEISFVGKTEAELTDTAVPYEVGISRYRELARGQILGDSYGMLKLLVSPTDRTILGVHVFGTGATEVVHIGQTLMGNGGTVDYLVDSVFNYPTLAESYKVAALDAQNKLRLAAQVGG